MILLGTWLEGSSLDLFDNLELQFFERKYFRLQDVGWIIFCEPANKNNIYFSRHRKSQTTTSKTISDAVSVLLCLSQWETSSTAWQTLSSPKCWGLGLLFNWCTCYQTGVSLHVVNYSSAERPSSKSASLSVFQMSQTTKEWVYFEKWGGESLAHRSSNLRRDLQTGESKNCGLHIWVVSIIMFDYI